MSPEAITWLIARVAARKPASWTSSVIGVNGPGSVSDMAAALNTGKRGSIRSSNSPCSPSGGAASNSVPSGGSVRRATSTGSGRWPGKSTAPLTPSLRPVIPRTVSATASLAPQPNSKRHASCTAATSRSGISWGQVGRRESRGRGSADLSNRRALAASIVSGIARSTAPVRLVATASTRNRSRSSTCSSRNGPVESLLRSRLPMVRQIIQSSCRPTGGAIRTTKLGAQLVDTSASACR
jgi:hypothetical protein